MITESDPVYKSISKLIEDGFTTAQIKRRVIGITTSEIKYVRKTRGIATEQTKRKKKRNPIEYLTKQGNPPPLNSTHEKAADKILIGADELVDELKLRISKLEPRVDIIGHKPIIHNDRNARLERQYKLWRRECVRRKIWADSVLYVLTKYVTLEETDRNYNKKKGWARDQVVRGLKCYVELFGS